VAGAILAFLSRHQPRGPHPQGWRLTATLAWEGVVYGITEGLLLSVLPVLVTWQAFAAPTVGPAAPARPWLPGSSPWQPAWP
jgi:uncharacterized membrane protein YedE/YeeE